MRVLVTGASGYLGRATVDALAADGHQVVALSHRSAAEWPAGVEIVRGDLLDQDSTASAVESADVVCHAAGLMGARTGSVAAGFYEVNLVGTLNVLKALEQRCSRTGRPGRLLHVSTGAVYGPDNAQPVSEQGRTGPLNLYGATKLAAEEAIRWHAGTGALGAVVLRVFNMAGCSGQGVQPAASTIIARALAVAAGQDPELTVNGDGSAVRDFVHVLDVADAVRRLVTAIVPAECRVYNVGAEAASVAQVIAAVERVARRPVSVRRGSASAAEIQVLMSDTTALRRDTGWLPVRSDLHRMISEQWSAIRGPERAKPGPGRS